MSKREARIKASKGKGIQTVMSPPHQGKDGTWHNMDLDGIDPETGEVNRDIYHKPIRKR